MFNQKSQSGYTLIEVMITAAIIGIIFSIVPQFFFFATKFQRLNNARLIVQRDARSTMALLNKNIRQAVSSSVVIDNAPSQPPYSRITFNKVEGAGTESVRYFQEGKNLKETRNGRDIVVAENLAYLAFIFPRSDDMQLVSVSLTLSEETYQGEAKALQMSVEKIEVMN